MANLFVGVDGGGTKTSAVLVREDLSVVKDVRGACTNQNSIGNERAKANLLAVLDELFQGNAGDRSLVRGITLSMAGVDREAAKALIRAWVRACLPVEEACIRVCSDAVAGLAAGTKGVERGVVLISGTGTIALAMDAPKPPVRAQGWGALFGDVGSGYWIGVEGMRAHARAEDGLGPPTAISPALQAYVGQDADVLEWAYKDGSTDWERFAKLAPLVLDAHKAGDKVASDILERAAQGLFESVKCAVSKQTGLGSSFTLVLVGGILTHEGSALAQRIREMMEEEFPESVVTLPELEPHVAAASLAVKAWTSQEK